MINSEIHLATSTSDFVTQLRTLTYTSLAKAQIIKVQMPIKVRRGYLGLRSPIDHLVYVRVCVDIRGLSFIPLLIFSGGVVPVVYVPSCHIYVVSW